MIFHNHNEDGSFGFQPGSRKGGGGDFIKTRTKLFSLHQSLFVQLYLWGNSWTHTLKFSTVSPKIAIYATYANTKTSMELADNLMYDIFFFIPTVQEWHSQQAERYNKIMHTQFI